MKLPIVGGTYLSPSADTNFQRTVNMFPMMANKAAEIGAEIGTEKVTMGSSLVPAPGLELLTELEDGDEIRGILTTDDAVYVVCGPQFYKLTLNQETGDLLSVNLLHTISSSNSGPVSMAWNPTQVMLVDGTTTGYILDIASDDLNPIADGDFLGGATVCFIDGYFLYSPLNSGFIHASALNNGTSWNPLDIATAEGSPDNIQQLAVSRGELWVIGERSTEIWYDNGAVTGLPFQPHQGMGLEIGCGAIRSVAQLERSLIWLDNRGIIVQSQPAAFIRSGSTTFELVAISDDSIQNQIANYGAIADAIGISYVDRGHIFYQITFPSVRKTWLYDSATKIWTERTSYDPVTEEESYHRAHYQARIGLHNIVGGSDSSKLYLLTATALEDDGEPIHRERITTNFALEGRLMEVSRLQIRITTGLGPVTGTGSDPKISMQYTNDAGHTWSDPVERSMGPTGHYALPIIWNRLGSGREWAFRFTISEPIEFSIVDAYIQISEPEEE